LETSKGVSRTTRVSISPDSRLQVVYKALLSM